MEVLSAFYNRVLLGWVGSARVEKGNLSGFEICTVNKLYRSLSMLQDKSVVHDTCEMNNGVIYFFFFFDVL